MVAQNVTVNFWLLCFREALETITLISAGLELLMFVTFLLAKYLRYELGVGRSNDLTE